MQRPGFGSRQARFALQFTRPCGRAGVHQDGDVHRDNEQQQADTELKATNGELRLRSLRADERVRVGLDLGPDFLVRVRKRHRHPLAERRDFGLRVLQRETGRNAAEDVHPYTRTRGPVGIGRAERHPVSMVDRKTETLRHHPDDGVWRLVQPYDSSEDTGVTIETALPLVVCDHKDRRSHCPFVFGEQRPSKQRRIPGERQARGGDRGDIDQVQLAVSGDQIPTVLPERAEIANRFQLALPLLEIMHRRAGAEPGCPARARVRMTTTRPSLSKGKLESSIVPNAAK